MQRSIDSMSEGASITNEITDIINIIEKSSKTKKGAVEISPGMK